MQPASTRHASSEPAPPLPLVSIVIPCYRQAHFLPDAIESALAQDYPAVEVVVVNDGSPDETAAVAARYPVRYIGRPNGGLASARNAGLAACRGEFVVFLDADDRLFPGGLGANATRLAADPRLGFVSGTSRYIAVDGTPLKTEHRPWPDGDFYTALLRRNRIRMPAMVMYRRSALAEVGGFDSRVDACADYDMHLRISARFPVALHDTIVAEYRRHGGNMSLDSALMLRQLCRVLSWHRKRVGDSPPRAAALRDGRRIMQEYYGDQLADRIRARVRARKDLGRAVVDAWRLLVLHPRGFFVHAVRKASNARRRRRPADGPDVSVAMSR